MMPRVAIVVLNWNGYEDTEECIESLEQITYSNYEVVIVDNGSTDGSAQKLAAAFPRHRVLQNETNLGFARGCNVGLRDALSRGPDYLLLLNNDAVVETGFLEPAVTRMESDPAIGLVSGKIYFRDRPGRIWYAGGRINLLKGSPRLIGRGQQDTGQFDRPREVTFATGALMLIRRSVMEKVGLLPEEYFFGEEDWDYCTAIRRAGYRLYYVPESVVHHKPRGSHSADDPKYRYSFHRGRLIFLRKFLPRPLFAIWLALFRCHSFLVGRWRLGHVDREMRTAFAFALHCARRDHRERPSGPITEQDLHSFQARLNARLRPDRRERQPVGGGSCVAAAEGTLDRKG